LEKIAAIEKSNQPPFSMDPFALELYSTLRGFFNFDLRPARFGHFREIRAEDLLVQAQHQATALGAQGHVIVHSGHPLFPAPTIYTLIFINWHN
jgi:hypothetical protein